MSASGAQGNGESQGSSIWPTDVWYHSSRTPATWCRGTLTLGATCSSAPSHPDAARCPPPPSACSRGGPCPTPSEPGACRAAPRSSQVPRRRSRATARTRGRRDVRCIASASVNVRGAAGAAPPWTRAMRISGLLFAFGLLGGCISDGNFADGGPSSSGVRWSGPFGYDPYSRSPLLSGNPDGTDRYGRIIHGGRTFRPNCNVVCDRATETCYRGREVDASETRDYFGRSAARQVDRDRDAAGTNRIYRVGDGVVCDPRRQVCLKDGRLDRSDTRDYFGKKAARRVD